MKYKCEKGKLICYGRTYYFNNVKIVNVDMLIPDGIFYCFYKIMNNGEYKNIDLFFICKINDVTK